MKLQNKLMHGLSVGIAIFTALTPITSFAASSSGNTTGSVTNTINTAVCTGTGQVSGTDASVFSQIRPDNAGTIVCSKSDGFKTIITGNDTVNNYHWTAWYKNKQKDDVDRTAGNGNYYGFKEGKVKSWKEFEKEIRELNNGKFPAMKDYIYPTDTAEGTLDFWGDKAGYYGILGDPRYQSIRLESYQQFSYRVERVETSYSVWTDPNYVPPYYGDDGDAAGASGSGPVGGSGNPSGNTNKKPKTCKQDPSQAKCKPPVTNKPVCDGGMPTWYCMTYNNGPGYCSPSQIGAEHCNTSGIGQGSSSASNTSKPNTGTSWAGAPNHASSSETYYLGEGRYQTVTTTVYSYNETKQVKVADATVGNGAYATEIGAYGLLNLVPGANTTKQYNVDSSGFWKTTPSYWGDGGKLTINNNGGYAYGFVDARENPNGVNKVNLYKYISTKDKLYDVIHGYKKVPSEICKGVCKPAGEDETPLANVELDIKKDEPQSESEFKKFVHLDKNPDAK